MAVTNRPHWSYSALAQYLRCPLQYYFERVDRIPRGPTSGSLVLGSAVHHTLAEYHLRLRRGGQFSENDARIVFAEGWQNQLDHCEVDFGDADEKDLFEKGIELVRLWMNEPPPGEIVAVEQSFLVPVQDGEGSYLEHPVVAIVDLIVREKGRLKLIEFKTSGRSYGEREVETSLQATCYVHACRESLGEHADVEYAILVKTKTPKLQRLETSRNEQDIRRLGNILRQVQVCVDSGVFYPVESPMNCSTCSYKGPCKTWPNQRHCAERELVSLEMHEAD